MKKHLIKHNAIGDPIYYYTLTTEEIDLWRKEQTEEQIKLTLWLERLWSSLGCIAKLDTAPLS